MRNGPDLKQKPGAPDDAAQDSADQKDPDDHVFPTARGVLSAAEIEALLRPKTLQNALDIPPPESIEPKAHPSFDQDQAPTSPDDMMQRQRLGARLSMALGKGAGMKAAVIPGAAATVARSELSGLLYGKSSAIACLGRTETDIEALVCLPPQLADAIIAKACGARGSTGRIGDGWSLSAIDCALLEQLLEPFGQAVGDTLRLQAIETDVPYVSGLLAATEVKISEFSIEAPGLHTEMAVIQIDQEEAADLFDVDAAPPAPVTALTTARLASLTVPLSRITELKAGSTLLLGLPVDQPIELLSGGRDGQPAYQGRMGRKGNKMAIKITNRVRGFRKD